MVEPKFLIVPPEAKPEVEALFRLPTAKLQALRAALNERKVGREGRDYVRVAAALGVGYDQAIQLLSAVSNIRQQKERFKLSDDDLYADARALGLEVDEADVDRRAALLDVLARSDEEYFAAKLSSLRHALVPHVSDVRTIVDARPLFKPDHGQVEGYLLLTHLELTVHDGHGDLTQHTFSLSKSDIETLKAQLDTASKKLDVLERSLGQATIFE